MDNIHWICIHLLVPKAVNGLNLFGLSVKNDGQLVSDRRDFDTKVAIEPIFNSPPCLGELSNWIFGQNWDFVPNSESCNGAYF